MARSRLTWSPTSLSPRTSQSVFPVSSRDPLPRSQSATRTQISPLQRLIREPDLEPPALCLLVELRHRQTRAVHRNGVADMAVVEDGRRFRDRERAAALVPRDRGDFAEVFDLEHCVELSLLRLYYNRERTRPVNIAKDG